MELFEDENIRISGGIRVSDDGQYLAFMTSRGGEDWNEIHVFNTETKKLLADRLEKVKYSDISWADDGFYYCRYDNIDRNKNGQTQLINHKVYYHKIGELQSQDKLVFENRDAPYNTFLTQIMPEGKYLFLIEEDIKGDDCIYFKDLSPEDNQFSKIIDFDGNNYSISGIMNEKILIRTNKDAPNNKLIALDANNADIKTATTIIGENENLLRSVSLAGGKLIALYMVDACADILVLDKNDSEINRIPLPSKGWSDGIVSNANDNEVLFSFSSYTYPYINYRYDISTNRIEILNFDSPDSFDPEQFITRQEFFPGKDSTLIPMLITYKRGITLNGNNPVYIYAYGGFNISQTPQFQQDIIPFLERGGVYVVPNLRGGGEYGESWHKAGTKRDMKHICRNMTNGLSL